MSPAEIEKLKALEREATSGPWEWDDKRRELVAVSPEEYDRDGTRYSEALSRYTHRKIVESDGGCYGPRGADALLLPAMRNALRRLLEERERLLEALEELLRLGERFGPAAADRARAALAFATAPAGKEEK